MEHEVIKKNDRVLVTFSLNRINVFTTLFFCVFPFFLLSFLSIWVIYLNNYETHFFFLPLSIYIFRVLFSLQGNPYFLTTKHMVKT